MEKPQVIFLDAVGTLFGVKGSVGAIYSQIAADFGVEVVAKEDPIVAVAMAVAVVVQTVKTAAVTEAAEAAARVKVMQRQVIIPMKNGMLHHKNNVIAF